MEIKFLTKFRRSEYTGENRCEPCTVLNLILAALFSSGLARKSRLVGYTSLFVSVILIYFRGYLIPGTPRLTKRYLPPVVLQWFGKEPGIDTRNGLGSASAASTTALSEPVTKTLSKKSPNTAKEVDIHDYYFAEGILRPCDDRDDLCLVDEFRTAWSDEMAELTDNDIDASEAVTILGVETEAKEFKVQQYGDAWTLSADSRTIGQWPSQKALVADVGAAHVLNEWSDYWGDLDPTQKGQILNGLRLFLNQCPGADKSVTMSRETVESCCSSHDVVTVSCDETGERLFEQRLNDV